VVLIQLATTQQPHESRHLWLGFILILIAAIAYPLGNRSIMLHLERTGITLSVYQRVLGMTLASLPFWLLIAVRAYQRSGAPTGAEVGQSFLIALSSGVVATLLFFRATDIARADATSLAAVEATQAAEVLFVLLGDVMVLGTPWPGRQAALGIILVVLGITAYSTLAHRAQAQAA